MPVSLNSLREFTALSQVIQSQQGWLCMLDGTPKIVTQIDETQSHRLSSKLRLGVLKALSIDPVQHYQQRETHNFVQEILSYYMEQVHPLIALDTTPKADVEAVAQTFIALGTRWKPGWKDVPTETQQNFKKEFTTVVDEVNRRRVAVDEELLEIPQELLELLAAIPARTTSGTTQAPTPPKPALKTLTRSVETGSSSQENVRKTLATLAAARAADEIADLRAAGERAADRRADEKREEQRQRIHDEIQTDADKEEIVKTEDRKSL